MSGHSGANDRSVTGRPVSRSADATRRDASEHPLHRAAAHAPRLERRVAHAEELERAAVLAARVAAAALELQHEDLARVEEAVQADELRAEAAAVDDVGHEEPLALLEASPRRWVKTAR